MTLGYRCDNCLGFTEARSWIFNCIECGKEICEDCMYSWATCKECAAGKTDEFLAARFDSACCEGRMGKEGRAHGSQ
jgi:hypothetical protein